MRGADWKKSGESFDEMVTRKRAARMDRIDSLPKELRELVHEYGFTVVKTLMDMGISKPNQIRHVVEMILDEFSPTRGCFSHQGIRTEVTEHLKSGE